MSEVIAVPNVSVGQYQIGRVGHLAPPSRRVVPVNDSDPFGKLDERPVRVVSFAEFGKTLAN
jgi:hypothetical protein